MKAAMMRKSRVMIKNGVSRFFIPIMVTAAGVPSFRGQLSGVWIMVSVLQKS